MKVTLLEAFEFSASQHIAALFPKGEKSPKFGEKQLDDVVKKLGKAIDLEKSSARDFFLSTASHPTMFSLAFVDGDTKPQAFVEIGAALSRKTFLKERPPLTLFLSEQLLKSKNIAVCLQAFFEGCVLGAYGFEKYRKEKKGLVAPGEVRVIAKGLDQKTVDLALARAQAMAASVCIARDLVNEQPSVANPDYIATFVKKHFKKSDVDVEIMTRSEIEELEMGGILGVARGGDGGPRVVKMSYNPKHAKKHIALIGKGVTFDSGGLCLKNYPGIETMKCDMAGAAAVIGILNAVAELKLPIRVTGCIGLVENLVSETSYKPGDILTMMSGKTVEVINTDAEGRLVLADLLHHIQKEKPDEVIDIATLTGNCMVALGLDMSGVLTNNQAMADRFLKAAKDSSYEYFWQLPLFEPYREQLKNDISDLRNIGKSHAGCITAGLFLSEFVGKDLPWLHLDIAGPAMSEDKKPHLPKGGTGVSVKSIVEYVLSQLA